MNSHRKAFEEYKKKEYLDRETRKTLNPDWCNLKRIWIEELLNNDKELFELYIGKISTNPLDIQRPIVSHIINSIRSNNMNPIEAFTLTLKEFAKYVYETDKRLVELESIRPNQIVVNCEKVFDCPYNKDKGE